MFASASQDHQTHNYQKHSQEYSKIGIEGTYLLAFNAVAKLITHSAEYRQLWGKPALDFGCGTGRSTRFLRSLGFETLGIDVNPHMLAEAGQLDPSGQYQLIEGDDLPFPSQRFDLIFQSFVLLEYATMAQMITLMQELYRVLKPHGKVIIVTATEAFYTQDWYSFGNRIPENQALQSGDMARVAIQGTDIVLYDYYWSDRDYRAVFEQAGFEVAPPLRPLAQGHEPYVWVNELEHPCWAIYSLSKSEGF
ncbi:MAG: class I SAM-dependent methyltransferase [Oculatellaceae cyanobacterium Prado106]|jgi:ubiquinone/menaquinone biosynthesis C-methylase UbiE|nr:class I SAM-dependent methyltransferase [Oculatellaceae cyanobacterium Prado106]